MINADDPVWDGRLGTAGGAAFGKGLNALAAEREVSHGRLAEAIGLPLERLAAVLGGSERVGISALARLTQALRTRPIEFLQRTGILSLEVYAFGLDPLYFLPDGAVRYEARYLHARDQSASPGSRGGHDQAQSRAGGFDRGRGARSAREDRG